jgi:hypothetical protein
MEGGGGRGARQKGNMINGEGHMQGGTQAVGAGVFCGFLIRCGTHAGWQGTRDALNLSCLRLHCCFAPASKALSASDHRHHHTTTAAAALLLLPCCCCCCLCLPPNEAMRMSSRMYSSTLLATDTNCNRTRHSTTQHTVGHDPLTRERTSRRVYIVT